MITHHNEIEIIYTILKTFLALLLSVIFAGYGLTKILIPSEKIKSYGLSIIPLFGLSIIILLLYNFGYLGLSVKESIALLFILTALLNSYILIRKRCQMYSILKLCRRDMPVLFLALVVFIVSIIPLLISQHYIISYNSDMVTHILVSEYLENNGIVTPIVENGRADLCIVAHRLNTNYPLGFMLFQAFIDSLTNLKAYKTFHTITAFLLSLTVISIYLFFKKFKEINDKYIIIFMMPIAFNTILFWVHFDAFGPNMMGVSLIPVALAVTLDAIESNSKKLVVAAVILVSAVMSAYSMAVYFVYIIALLYLIANSFDFKSLGNYVLVIILSILLNIKMGLYLITHLMGLLYSIIKRMYIVVLSTVKHSISTSTTQSTTLPPVDNGNIWFPVTIERFFGLMPFKTNEILDYGLLDTTLAHVLVLIAVIYLLILIIYGIYYSEKRKEFILYTTFLIGVYITLWKIGYTYWLFKCVSLTLFIFFGIVCVGFSLIMRDLTKRRKTTLKSIAIILFIVVIILNIYSIYILVDAKKELRYVDLESFLDTMNVAVSKFDNDSRIAVITYGNQFYDTWSIYFLKGRKIYSCGLYAYNINQILRKPSAGILNLDNINFSKVDAIIVCINSTLRKEYGELRSLAYIPIYKNKNFVIYIKNDTVIDHFPAEKLVRVPCINYHQGLIYTNDGNTVAKLSQGDSLAINVTKNTVSINNESFNTYVTTNKVYVGLLIYSLQNSSLTIFINHSKNILNLDRGVYYKSFEVHTPSKIIIKNNYGFILVDSIDLLKNKVEYHTPTKLLIYGQVDSKMPTMPKAKSLSFQTIFLNNSSIKFKLHIYNISNVSISLDIYTRKNASHPKNHYGYWTVYVPKDINKATIEFILNPINKACIAYMNKEPIEFQNYWKGNISNGSFIANIAIWKNRNLKFLISLAEFDIVKGKIVKFKVLNNGFRNRVLPDISINMLVCQADIKNFAISIDISKHWDLPLERKFGYFGTYTQDKFEKLVHLGYCNIYVDKDRLNEARYVCNINITNRSCYILFNDLPKTISSQFNKELTDGRYYVNFVIWKYDNISAIWRPLVRYIFGYFEVRNSKVENLILDKDFVVVS